MQKFSQRDAEVLKLFMQLNNGKSYNPPSYSCVREFTPSFPQKPKLEFVPDPEPQKTYIETYRKTILSTL